MHMHTDSPLTRKRTRERTNTHLFKDGSFELLNTVLNITRTGCSKAAWEDITSQLCVHNPPLHALTR